MMERAHRKYSPSNTERNDLCHGSTQLIARVPPRPDQTWTIEGRKAHDVLEAALRAGCRDAEEGHREHSVHFFEELNDNSNEFYLAIQIALDHVYGILDEHPDAKWWIEEFVDPPCSVLPGETGGYCDVCIYVPSTRTLYVIDYKHGAGVAKDAIGNSQIKQYGAGFLYDERGFVDPAQVDTVQLTIVQPRAFHDAGIIRSDEATPAELWHYLTWLDDLIVKCEAPDAPLTPGDVQCRFCDAAPHCPAREAQALQVANKAYQQIGQVREPDLPTPSSLDMKRIAEIKFHAPTLRKWLDSIETYAEGLVRQGHYMPGLKLVENAPRREYFGDEAHVARSLAAMLGERGAEQATAEYEALMEKYPVLRKIFQYKLMPVTTAEKLVKEAYKNRVGKGRKKKAAEEAGQAFAFLTLKKSNGGTSVVREDDPRPAVNLASDHFQNIAGLIPPPPQ